MGASGAHLPGLPLAAAWQTISMMWSRLRVRNSQFLPPVSSKDATATDCFAGCCKVVAVTAATGDELQGRRATHMAVAVWPSIWMAASCTPPCTSATETARGTGQARGLAETTLGSSPDTFGGKRQPHDRMLSD